MEKAEPERGIHPTTTLKVNANYINPFRKNKSQNLRLVTYETMNGKDPHLIQKFWRE